MQMQFWPNILKRLQVLWENPISAPATISTTFEKIVERNISTKHGEADCSPGLFEDFS